VQTPHREAIEAATMSQPTLDATLAQTAVKKANQRPKNINKTVQKSMDSPFKFDLSEVNINLAELIVNQFADAIVLGIFLGLLGGRPRDFLAR
jgi:hypothetical protein